MDVSEHRPIAVSHLSSALSQGSSPLSGNVRVNMGRSTENTVHQGSESAYTVDISREGRDQQARAEQGSEKDDARESISSGLAAKETSEGDQAQSHIDAQIEILQEQIKEVKEKIAALADDDSEAAEQQRTALETQLLQLTNQLMSLLEEKAKSG